jgi:hypothetical protein
MDSEIESMGVETPKGAVISSVLYIPLRAF